jgi:hypothetical protein
MRRKNNADELLARKTAGKAQKRKGKRTRLPFLFCALWQIAGDMFSVNWESIISHQMRAFHRTVLRSLKNY